MIKRCTSIAQSRRGVPWPVCDAAADGRGAEDLLRQARQIRGSGDQGAHRPPGRPLVLPSAPRPSILCQRAAGTRENDAMEGCDDGDPLTCSRLHCAGETRRCAAAQSARRSRMHVWQVHQDQKVPTARDLPRLRGAACAVSCVAEALCRAIVPLWQPRREGGSGAHHGGHATVPRRRRSQHV